MKHLRKQAFGMKKGGWYKALVAVAAFALALGGVAVPSALAAGDVVDTQNVNHMRTATMTASGVEDSLTADKAADGKTGKQDRWSSGTAKPEKNDKTWLMGTFAKPTQIKQFNVQFEDRTVAVMPGNVKGFTIQYQTDGSTEWKDAKVVANEQSGSGYKTSAKVVLENAITAKAVRLTNFDIATDASQTQWNGVSVVELEAYSNEQVDGVVSTPDVNHLLGGTASSSRNEANTLTPDKAIDGDESTRWSSSEAKPNSEDFLAVTLKQPTLIKQFEVQFEKRSSPVMPSNVKSFEIQYKDGKSAEWKTAKAVANKAEGDGFATKVKVVLDAPVTATEVRLTKFDVQQGSTQWNGVSVVEFKAYSNEADERHTLDGVVDSLKGGVVAKDASKLDLPKVPQGFEIKLNGADFEQVIGDDLSVVHPLTNKTVKVSWTVTEVATGKSKTSQDLDYTVEGAKTQAEGKNVKPQVVPEIQEWFSDSNAKLSIDAISSIVYSDASLKAVAEEFKADFKDFTGKDLALEQGSPKDGAFNFTLAAPANDALLGDEGYTMAIGANRIDVQSQHVTGNMYGMQTILQMYRLDASGFPVGQMRDYPRFEVRGFMWDVARKPVSLDMMKMATRTMRYYKMNDFQAHLSDNLIFLEDYKTEDAAWKAYAAFRLETSVKNEQTGQSPTATDYSMTKDEFRDFIQSERALGMNIVPEIDMPAHAVAFTRTWPELAVHGEGLTVNSKRPAIDHFDLRKPQTMELIKDIYDDYTTGENPVFDEGTVVHVGADEFLIPNGSPVYHTFVNDLLPHIKKTNTVRMWGGLTWLNQGDPIVDAAINGEHGRTQMNLWSADWADGVKMYEMGFDLINTIDNHGYMVPNGGGGRSDAYGDYLNTSRVFNEFAPEKVRVKGGAYQYLPSGDDQMLGAAFAIWNDNIDTRASGLSEADEYARFFDAMPFYAEKTWAATGKEKGTPDALRGLVAKTGDAPRVNPYSKASKSGDTYAEYEFDNLKDTSANGRDLTSGKNAEAKDGVLNLAGGESYVESPLSKIAAGSELSFDIELTEPACPGDILFEADAPYGTLDIRVMDNGKLGFTRELYDYYFDYKLPVGKKVNVRIVTKAIDGVRPATGIDGAMETTSLYVDGNLVGKASGRFFDAGMVKKDGIDNATLTIPLERIGSKTQAIAAKIDNVRVAPANDEPAKDEFNKAAWRATTNSQTLTGESAGGRIEHAIDGDASTIWHSNWKGATEGNADGHLSKTNPIWAEIDFGKGYQINQFSFTPRSPQASGLVTKANLFIRTEKGGEWKQVAKDVTFKADNSKKTIGFDETMVYGVRFEATQSNDDWVAVSEFDIANKPLPASTVYAHGMSYAPSDDGELDLATGKQAGVITGSVEDADASESVYRSDVPAGSKVTLTAKPGKNMEFVGWFAPCSSEPVSTDPTFEVTAEYSVALEARFKRTGDTDPVPPAGEKHTVSFVVDGVTVSSAKVEHGQTVAKPDDPVKDGFTFDGWFLDGASYDFASPVTGDLTLTAHFTPKDTQGGGQGGEQLPGTGDKPDNKPGQKPGQTPGGKPGSSLPQTGDSSVIAVGGLAVAAVVAIAAAAAFKKRSL